ncbi:hypothetical protein ACY0L5_005612, partial [Klebsiella michiganensis]
MEFIFAFWNCAISPPGIKEMRAPANMADAVEVIVDLFTSKKIMFLALCEVNKDSFNHISSELGKLG